MMSSMSTQARRRSRRLVGAFAAALLAVLVVAGLYWSQGWSGWSWPGWLALASFGTMGSFLFLIVQTHTLREQVRDERAARESDERERAEEAVKAQARLVAAWVAEIAEQEQADPSEFYAITVRARNGSAEPVYEVVVTVDAGVRGTFDRHPDVLGPGEIRPIVITASAEPRGQPLAMLRRDRLLLEDGSSILLEDGSGVLLLENYVPAVSISFVDSAGRRWIRQPKGELQPLGT
jgi:uncharacterized membrane protein